MSDDLNVFHPRIARRLVRRLVPVVVAAIAAASVVGSMGQTTVAALAGLVAVAAGFPLAFIGLDAAINWIERANDREVDLDREVRRERDALERAVMRDLPPEYRDAVRESVRRALGR